MVGWDLKSQGKRQKLMNGIYHEEIKIITENIHQYNKGGTTYRFVKNCCLLFIVRHSYILYKNCLCQEYI